jgi:ATP adenylyltransferase
MDLLWTPWRYAYVTGADQKAGCIFCDAPKESDQQAQIVHRGTHCYVILNKYPYTNGHVMVVPYAHLDELQKLPADAAHEMMALTQRMETVLRSLYRPDGINLGMNIGKGRGRRRRRTHPHAYSAALGRRRQFRQRHRRDQGAARGARGDLGTDPPSAGREPMSENL